MYQAIDIYMYMYIHVTNVCGSLGQKLNILVAYFKPITTNKYVESTFHIHCISELSLMEGSMHFSFGVS